MTTAPNFATAVKTMTDTAVTLAVINDLATEIVRNAGNPATVTNLALEIIEALDE